MLRHLLTFMFCVLITTFTTAQTAVQHYNDGIKLKDQKKYADALASFKKAIAVNPDYKEALYNAGWCSVELKKHSEALTYLQKAKTLWPNEPKVYLEIGYANESLGKKEEAKANYNKCISLKSDYALAYKYLAYVYYDEKNYDRALQYLKSYIGYDEDITSDEVYYRKGYCEKSSPVL